MHAEECGYVHAEDAKTKTHGRRKGSHGTSACLQLPHISERKTTPTIFPKAENEGLEKWGFVGVSPLG